MASLTFKSVYVDPSTGKLKVMVNDGSSNVVLDFGVLASNYQIQCGTVSIVPTAANVPTVASVVFTTPFKTVPRIQLTPNTAYPGTQVTGVGFSKPTTTGFDIYLTRTNTANTAVNWVATVTS